MGGLDWEIVTDTYTLPCIKQITNENWLHSTENSTQCLLVISMGRKSKKEGIYVCIWFCCGLFIYSIIVLRYDPSIPNLLRVFAMKDCWILPSPFLHLLRWSWVFPHFVNVVYYVDWLVCVESSLHPMNKSHLIME